MRKRLITFGVIALLAGGGVLFYFNSKGQEEVVPTLAGGQTQAEVPAEKSFPIETIEVAKGDVVQDTTLNVTFIAQNSVPIMAKAAGTVEKVSVKVGDQVKKGQVLYTIDDRQYKLQTKQAEAAYEAAQANLAQMEKGASVEDLRQAEAGVAQAEAALAGAIKGLENAEKVLADRTQYKQQLQGAQTQVELAKSQLEAAKAGAAQAQTAFENAQAEYQRMQELFDKEMISRQQLDGVRLQFESAKAGYEAATERLNQARIGLGSAQESLSLAQETYDNPTAIVGQADAAKTQVKVAEAGLEVAQARLAAAKKGASQEQLDAVKAQVKQAKTATELARLQLEYTKVTAPISGQVAQLNVEEGSMAAPGNPSGVIANVSAMKAKALVPETYINKLAVGHRVALTATALPGTTFYGKISSINPMADMQTRQFPVEVQIDNKDGKLKAGMFGTVSLVIGEVRDTLVVPISTILYDRGQPFVYAVVDGRAQEARIEPGLSNDEVVEVVYGLSQGAVVISNGQYQVKNGALVEVK